MKKELTNQNSAFQVKKTLETETESSNTRPGDDLKQPEFEITFCGLEVNEDEGEEREF